MPQTTTRYPLPEIDRGERILLVVGSLRFATGIQLRRAIFDRIAQSPRQARYRATKSLHRLFDSGYLRRIRVFCPAAASDQLALQVVNVLSAQGTRAIGLDPRLAWTRAPKPRSVLTHDFWLVELGVLAFAGFPDELVITHWWNDRVLAARKRKSQLSLPIIPDALLVVRNTANGKDFPCLMELDLGTESVTASGSIRADFSQKIAGYLDYLGPRFRQEFAINAPPIVLIVTDSERRLQSLRDTTQQLGGAGRFWFASLPGLRGLAMRDDHQTMPSPVRRGAFWGATWLTAAHGQPRSLASRCRVSGTSSGPQARLGQ